MGSVGVGNGRVSWGSGVCVLELTPSELCSRPPKIRGQSVRTCSCEAVFETDRPMRRMGWLRYSTFLRSSLARGSMVLIVVSGVSEVWLRES